MKITINMEHIKNIKFDGEQWSIELDLTSAFAKVSGTKFMTLVDEELRVKINEEIGNQRFVDRMEEYIKEISDENNQ